MESVGNSTIQTLGYADASSSSTLGYYPNIFDGTPQDTTQYGMVHITCQADASGIIRAMHSIDNSLWDFIDTINYPGEDASIGQCIHVRKDLKAKWYKTEFIHANTDTESECNLRLQTVFHPAATPAEPHDVKLFPTIDVCIGTSIDLSVNSLDVCVSFPDTIDVNIVQQDASYLTVSGPVILAGQSAPITVGIDSVSTIVDVCVVNPFDIASISNPVDVNVLTVSFGSDTINVNVINQDLDYINVSGTVIIDNCINIGNNVNVTVDNSYITVSGTVNVRDLSVNTTTTPISQVWQSDEISDTVTVSETSLVLYTVHCMNFAPDYRFVKIYDTCGTITASDRPKMTLPVVADVPYNMQFPNGLQFNNALQVKATRCLRYNDVNLAEEGDVHLILTYSSP